jgi:flagellin-like protein
MVRGISETISTLLVLLIVVSLGVGVLSWGNQYIANLKQSMDERAYVTQEGLKEWPIVEHVIFSDTQANISVRNVGFAETVIDTIYIKKMSTGEETLISLSPVTIEPGDATFIVVSYSFTAGETYIFTLVSKRGTKVSYTDSYGG